MSARNLILSSAFLLPLLTATPAAAQRVEADIRIGGGPVSGRVIIGDRDRYRDRYDDYYLRRRYIDRVEWIRVRDRGLHRGWFKKFRRDARVVVVYYDRRNNGYYDRYNRGFERVRLYEMGGRYYRLDDDRYWDRFDDRDDDRFDRYDDRRDDRRDARRNDRRDDRRDDRNRGDWNQ
ncbi:MAG TPA: hypothetical protein VF187_08090 [Gemmatimonadales bacterium]